MSFSGVFGLALSEAELTQPASTRYTIAVLGGDAVFLVERRVGHKLYMGVGRPLSRPEVRRYVDSLNRELESLSLCDFLAKYDLHG